VFVCPKEKNLEIMISLLLCFFASLLGMLAAKPRVLQHARPLRGSEISKISKTSWKVVTAKLQKILESGYS